MGAKGNIRNPSAFIAKSLSTFPMKRGTSLEFALKRYPALRDTLDGQALAALESANPDRAVEIIEDIGSKLSGQGHSFVQVHAAPVVQLQPTTTTLSFRSGAAPLARFAPAVHQPISAFQRAPVQSPRPPSHGG